MKSHESNPPIETNKVKLYRQKGMRVDPLHPDFEVKGISFFLGTPLGSCFFFIEPSLFLRINFLNLTLLSFCDHLDSMHFLADDRKLGTS